MNQLAERLKKSRLAAGKSQGDVAEAVGIKQPTYQALESGKTKKSAYLTNIAKYLGVDPFWLATGEGTKNLELRPVSDWDSDTPLDDDEVEIPFFKDFSFACGNGSINEIIANEKRKLRMSKYTLRTLDIDKMHAVAATASGDSMMPTIKDGDTIHIDLGRKNIKDGKIFVVCLGGLYYCKRLYNLPFGGVRIVSDNSDEFPEIHLTASQIIEQDFNVIGWIWQIATMEKW